MKSKYVLLLVLVLVLAGVGLFYSGSLKLSFINPGPEGINVIVYGVHYRGEWANASSYSSWTHKGWSANVNEKYVYLKIVNYTRGVEDHDYYILLDDDPTDVEVRISRPIITRLGEEVSFEASKRYENGTVVYFIRKAKIIDAEFNVELRSVPGTGYGGVENIDVWLAVQGVAWQKFLHEDSPPNASFILADKTGVIIPLMVYATSVDAWAWVDENGNIKTWYPDETAKDNVKVFPEAAGDVLGLRSEPSYSYSVESPPNNISDNLKEFVAEWSPDWRLNKDTWYTYISIQYLEPHLHFNWLGQLDDAYYPSTSMKLHVVALAVGEFKYLWTQEEASEHNYKWDWVGSLHIDIQSLTDLFRNPWFWVGLGSLLIVLVLILLLATGGSALLSGLVAGLVARKR